MAERDAAGRGGKNAGGSAPLRAATLVGDGAAGFRPRLRTLTPLSPHAAAVPGAAGRMSRAWADALTSRWQSALSRVARADFAFAGSARGEAQTVAIRERVVERGHERTRFLRPHLTLRLTLAATAPVEHRATAELFERTLQVLKDSPPPEAGPAPVTQVFHVPLGRDEVERRYARAATPAPPTPGPGASAPHARRERQEMVLRREGPAAESRPARLRRDEVEGGVRDRATTPRAVAEAAAAQPPSPAWPDVGALTDQVMQRMQQRLVAQRERMGRV